MYGKKKKKKQKQKELGHGKKITMPSSCLYNFAKWIWSVWKWSFDKLLLRGDGLET